MGGPSLGWPCASTCTASLSTCTETAAELPAEGKICIRTLDTKWTFVLSSSTWLMGWARQTEGTVCRWTPSRVVDMCWPEVAPGRLSSRAEAARPGARGAPRSSLQSSDGGSDTGWIRRFILFHGKRHPREMGKARDHGVSDHARGPGKGGGVDAEPGALGVALLIPPRGGDRGAVAGRAGACEAAAEAAGGADARRGAGIAVVPARHSG